MTAAPVPPGLAFLWAVGAGKTAARTVLMSMSSVSMSQYVSPQIVIRIYLDIS